MVCCFAIIFSTFLARLGPETGIINLAAIVPCVVLLVQKFGGLAQADFSDQMDAELALN
jgi:hypothetical protein